METFKQCSRGHYYQGEECPWCNAKSKLFDDTIETPVVHSSYMNVCHNGHAYELHLNCCPYCGEKEVIKHIDMWSSRLATLKMMLEDETSIKVDKYPECRMKTLEVSFLINRYRTDYKIDRKLNFNYKSIIRIDGLEFTGKEFVKWVDFMIGVKAIENH